MKKLLVIITAMVFTFIYSSCEEEIMESIEKQSVELSSKSIKMVGYDQWGFNYQAQHFEGYLINMILADPAFMYYPHYKQHVYNGEGSVFWDMLASNYWYFEQELILPEFLLDCRLASKWNSGILSKDGVYPESWVDSNGKISFHYSMITNGKRWSHMRKLISSRSTDLLIDGIWYNEDGHEIGIMSKFWPDLIIIQVINTGEVSVEIFYDEYNAPHGVGSHK